MELFERERKIELAQRSGISVRDEEVCFFLLYRVVYTSCVIEALAIKRVMLICSLEFLDKI